MSTKVTTLPELTDPIESDVLMVVDDPGGSPVSKKMEIKNLLSLVRRNFIINGGMEVYQRQTAYTLVKDVYGIAVDRFYGMATGTAVSAGIMEQTSAASLGRIGWAIKFSSVTLTGTGILYLRYRMESKDAIKFKNTTASFSSKVRHNVGSAINYTVYIRKANVADDFSAVTEISNSGAQSVSSATNTDLKYENISMGDCSNGIEIEIKVECGAVAAKNFWFFELQFEEGVKATTFEFQPFAKELALCQRYYEKSYNYTGAPGTATLYGASVVRTPYTSAVETTYFSVRKRANPTMVWYSTATGASGYVRDLSTNADKAASTYTQGEGCASWSATMPADNTLVGWHWTAVAEL
jgi:hypothetical protein